MASAREAAVGKSEAAVTSALKTVYFAAKHDLPLSLVPSLNQLCIDQGGDQLKDLRVDDHTTYSHSSSIAGFLSAIAHDLEVDLVGKVKQSDGFSLMVDESTDTSVHQNLIVFIRIMEHDSFGRVNPATYFLGITQLDRATADSIHSALLRMLDSKGIDVFKLRGISTDGAAVMVGNKSGLVTRLKSLAPGILATHCIAHRLALSCCSGADKIPYLVKFQEILNSIYKYFHYSPKNMSRFEVIQAVLESANRSRFKEVFHTRWLSFEGSVDAILQNFDALVSVLLEEGGGKALSMHKPITCFKFLFVAHFMADALKHLSVLSKMFQKKDIDFAEVNPLLSSTISSLEALDAAPGQRLSAFLKAVPSEPQFDSDGLQTFEFDGHTIRDGAKQREEAPSICKQFLTGVVISLRERFSSNADAVVMTSLSNFFNPITVSRSDNTGDIEIVSEYLDSVGLTGYREELVKFSEYVTSLCSSGSKLVCSVRDVCNLALKNDDAFPASAEAARRYLLIPVSTVECERGFSRQNLVKTSLRNRMSVETLEHLMRVNIDGPQSCQYDFSKAFKVWAKEKSRRILQ